MQRTRQNVQPVEQHKIIYNGVQGTVKVIVVSVPKSQLRAATLAGL